MVVLGRDCWRGATVVTNVFEYHTVLNWAVEMKAVMQLAFKSKVLVSVGEHDTVTPGGAWRNWTGGEQGFFMGKNGFAKVRFTKKLLAINPWSPPVQFHHGPGGDCGVLSVRGRYYLSTRNFLTFVSVEISLYFLVYFIGTTVYSLLSLCFGFAYSPLTLLQPRHI